MKFQTNDEHDIRWLANPGEYDVGDVVQKIKNAGRWEQFLEIQEEDGVVDCDALYDYLRYDAAAALLSVGLHYNEATATALDVVRAWAEAYEGDGLKVSYCADGKTPSGLQLFDYGGRTGVCLEFECVDTHGETDEVSLDAGEVLELVGDKAHGNATTGDWTGNNVETDVFEMWRED